MRLLLLLPTTTYRTEAFVEAALRLGVDLTVASEEDSAFSERESEGLLTLDFRSPAQMVAEVDAYAAEFPVDAVFGVDDETAVAAATISDALGLPHTPVPAVRAAGDKHQQRELLQAAGVPVPRYVLHEIDEDPRGIARVTQYPCVLKPLHLSASRGVIRVNSAEEFVFAHRRMAEILRAPDVRARGDEQGGRFLVEHFVAGPEFALEGLVVDGELHVLALWDKPDPLNGPFFAETIYVTPSRVPQEVQGELVDCAERATWALGLTRGPIHVELRHNRRGPWLIELAARPIGGKCGQALRFGADGKLSFEQVLLSHALGMLTEVPVRESSATGVMMLPVREEGVLRRVQGADDARRVRHVTDVVLSAHRGQRLIPLPEEAVYVGFIFARADTPDEVEQALREADERLRIDVG
jgi:biotin carboxylase